MTILSAPTPVGERPYSNVWCGQAASASVVTDWAGVPTLPPAIDASIPNSMRISGGTTATELVTALRAHGIPVKDPQEVPMSAYLTLIAQGVQGIGLHQCNGYAQPVQAGTSSIAHWRRYFGVTDTSVATMNPWTAQNEITPLKSMLASDLQVFIQVDGVFPADRIVAPPAVPVNEVTPMFASGGGIRLAVSKSADVGSDGGGILYFSTDLGNNWSIIPGRGRSASQLSVAYEAPTNLFYVWAIGMDGSWYYQTYTALSGGWSGVWIRTNGRTTRNAAA